jgi:hypothetical protein
MLIPFWPGSPKFSLSLFGSLLLVASAFGSNPIQLENAKPGTTAWQLSNGATNHQIEGYASAATVIRGGSISLFTNTADTTYAIDIFRMGWYGGLGGRRMLPTIQLSGTAQTACPVVDTTTSLLECNWINPYVLNVPYDPNDPTNWASGVYIVKLTGLTSGYQSRIIFVVRDDSSTSAYVFQSSVNTYQAYNAWGGKSLYPYNSSGTPATKVSFNRPYDDGRGAGQFFSYEINMLRFLEREGYDVTYITDVDLHENPSVLSNHQAALAVGHSEYWSYPMRTSFQNARDAGKGLGFFSSNNVYWQARYEPSMVNGFPDRTLVCYKGYTKDPVYLAGDPSQYYLVTVRWRDFPVNLPENTLVGLMYQNDGVTGDIVVTGASNPLFNTTGLQNGTHLTGLLGKEADHLYAGAPAGIQLLAHSPYTIGTTTYFADMSVYAAASGANVFDAGTFKLPWGLDSYGSNAPVNPGVQQLVRNVLANLIGDQPPIANAAGPYNGISKRSIQFDGTSSYDPDGVIVAYRWDFGDGTTSTLAQPTHQYTANGSYTVTLTVTDNVGSRNVATTNATIADQPIVSLSPSTLAFAAQQANTTSAPQTVTLTNTGTAALSITSIAITGDYSQTNSCGTSLAAAASCTISVIFAPVAAGTRTGALVITDNAIGNPHNVPLTGTGLAATTVSLSPSSLSFGSQAAGTTSAPQPVALTNTGTGTLNVANIATAGDFAQTNNCGTSMTAGTSCTINVSFVPTASGARSGTLSITDNAQSSPQTVSLTGTGIAPAVSLAPTSLSFQAQLVGSISAPQNVSLTNTGTDTLMITSISTTGDFAQTSNCGSSLVAGASCSITVTFSPTVAGTRTGTVLVADNASGSPQSVTLSGSGAYPVVAISSTQMTFASQQMSTFSSPQSIVLSNSGAVPLTISNISTAGDFSQTNNCGTVVAAGASCTLSVTYGPTIVGTSNGTLSITDNAGNSPQTVSLTGSGTAPTVTTGNPIQIENAKPGTSDWHTANAALNHQMEGYSSSTSVNRGGSISLYVNTADGSFTVDVFRMGWYSSLGARRMMAPVQVNAVQQPACPVVDSSTYLLECNWTNPYTLQVPGDPNDPTNWPSGVYLALLTGQQTGYQAYIIFTVRDDAGASPYVFQIAMNTYQAYNAWGGKSLYPYNSTGQIRAYKVSFNRPHDDNYGAGQFFTYEYNMVRFLESEGDNISYVTDVDVHENPNLLLSHNGDLTVGHSEYWSYQMRTNVLAARDSGVSLGFVSSNNMYRQIRFEPSTQGGVADRTMVCYKDYTIDPLYLAGDPSKYYLVTADAWRNYPTNLPEDAVIGIMYQNDNVGPADIIISDASSWLFNGTGLQNGSHITGLLGREVDHLYNDATTPPGIALIGHTPYTLTGDPTVYYGDMTLYTAPSGATVYAAGTFYLSWGVDGYDGHAATVSPAVQQMMRNLLANFVTVKQPVVSLSPTSLAFANQQVGTTSSVQTVTLSNTGSAALNISSIATTGDYAQTNNCGASLGAGASCNINVNFTPTASGTRTGTLSVTDNATGSPQTVALSGSGIAPAAGLTPASLTFANQLVGTTSPAQTVKLSNTGSVPLNISSIATAGDYTQTNNCGASLNAGTSCNINVSFMPTATGTGTGTLSVTDNATGSPQTVALSGSGIAPAAGLSPASLTFANQLVGTTSAAQSVALSNTGSAPLNISHIATAGDYTQTTNCGASLGAGASCNINVSFKPTATGIRTGTLSVTDNASDSPQTVALSGSGIAAGLSAASLTFANQLVGTTSPAQTVKLINTGSVTLNISSIATTGDYTQTNNCNASLGKGASCNINVSFTPTATGTRSGTLSVTDDGSGSPQTVALSGNGVAPAAGLSPASLTFANQLLGTTSPAQTVTLGNTGSAPLKISSIATTGDYTQTNNCGGGLNAGTSCNININLKPTAAGTRSGTLSVTDNASGSPQTMALSGNGIAPAAALSPVTLTFANQLVGTTSAAQSVTLSNPGSAPLNISQIATAGDYTQTNNCGSSLDAGASCTINVSFKPTNTGTRAGTLSVTDNASGSPQKVALTGTGVIPAVNLAPTSLNFGKIPVGTTSAPMNVTLSNPGTGILLISSMALTGPNPADYAQTNNCGGSVAPGASCTITITFTPGATGNRNATLAITDNAPKSPQNVPLTGSGT